MIMAIDIGSYKICGVIGHLTPDGVVIVEKATMLKSKGFAEGRVSNVDEAVQLLQGMIGDLYRQSPKKITEFWCSVSGLQVNSHWIQRTIKIPDVYVSKDDINALIGECMDGMSMYNTENKTDFLHVLPHMYEVDTVPTKTPEKMAGSELSVHTLMCMGDKTVIENIKSVFEDCNVTLKCIAVDGYMSGLSVLHQEELAMDFVLCIDMGDLCTSVSLFYQSELIWCKNFAIGSGDITKKIIHDTAMDTKYAEELKKKITVWTQGILYSDKKTPKSYARIGENGTTHQIAYINLCKMAQSEMEQMFKTIKDTIPEDYRPISRIVLTGGGNDIQGAEKLAEHVFDCPVRIGKPQSVQFKNDKDKAAISSAVLGTILYSQTHLSMESQHYIRQYDTVYTGGTLSRTWQWIRDNF